MIVSIKNVRCENTQVLRKAIAEEEEEEEEEEDDDDDDDFLGTTADHYLLPYGSRTGMDESYK